MLSYLLELLLEPSLYANPGDFSNQQSDIKLQIDNCYVSKKKKIILIFFF